MAELPHATVVMRDGTRVSGRGGRHARPPKSRSTWMPAEAARFPMKDVRRVDYGETATAVKPVPPATAPVPRRRLRHRLRHRATPPRRRSSPRTKNMNTPRAAAIKSTTRVLPVGTELPVRTEETIDSSKAVEGQVYAAEIAARREAMPTARW